MYKDRKKIHFSYFFIDLFLITTTFYFSLLVKYNFNLNQVSEDLILYKDYSLVFIFWTIILTYILDKYVLYATDRSLSVFDETYKVIKAVFFSSVVTALFIFWFKIEPFSRFHFMLIASCLAALLSLWRALKRILIRHFILHGNLNVNVLIVSADKNGEAIVEEVRNHPYLGLRIVGFLDDNKTGNFSGFEILGKVKDLEKIVRKNFVDEIYITFSIGHQKATEIAWKVKSMGKVARVILDSSDYHYFGELALNYLGFIPFITYYSRGVHGSKQFIKRFVDIIVSSCALFSLTPLFALVAFFIKFDSPGPILYISKRCGEKGRIFNFYKFRTMIKDAEHYKELLRHKSDVKGPVFKMKDDPRVTRVGKILRKYSLDELPQLINVFKGNMSLVGPRPPTSDEIAKYEDWQLRRLEIKPGITCLWQIRGRNELSFYKWIKWDLWYIDNWSLGLDIKILLWTIPVMLKGKGAY